MNQFNSNKKFTPAFTYPVNWSTGDNQFDDKDINPKTLSLKIPVKSIPEFCAFLMALEADKSKHKKTKSNTKQKENNDDDLVVYINAKGRESDDGYGMYGNINPAKINYIDSNEIPF